MRRTPLQLVHILLPLLTPRHRPRRLKLLRLGQRQPLVQRPKRRHEAEADADAPHAVDAGRVALDVHRVAVAQEDDHDDERADERAPALVREDVREQRAPPPQVRAVARDRRGHRVVAAHADPEDDAPDGEPHERAGGRDVACGVRDGHDGREDDEHQLFAV